MQSTLTPQLRYTLPVFVLFSLAGFYFIVLQMELSQAPDRFLDLQKQSQVPLSVTSNLPVPLPFDISLLDTIFTPLISFFVAAFGEVGSASASYPITLDFVWSFAAVIQIPLIESRRPGAQHTWLLTIPMAWGILYQRVSGGWVLPLWLLVWMQSRARSSSARLGKVDAEGVLAGWWVGHTLPALAMLVPNMPQMKRAPIWIAFPILMSAAQNAYVALVHFVPALAQRRNGTGYVATQLVFLSSLALSTIAHAHVVLIPGLAATPVDPTMSTSAALAAKLRGLFVHLYTHYVPPSLAIPTPAETTAISGVKHFVQFDVLIVFGAVWTAGIWDLALRRRQWNSKEGEIRWIAGIAVSLLVGGLFFGPGAATAAMFAWRERELEVERRKEDQELADGSPQMTLTMPAEDAVKISEKIETPLRSPNRRKGNTIYFA